MVEENKVLTGVVCWFDQKKGYGYVTKDDNSGDIFVHFSNILMDGFKCLKAGQVVSFEIGANHKGPQCVQVRIIKDAPKEDEAEEKDTF